MGIYRIVSLTYVGEKIVSIINDMIVGYQENIRTGLTINSYESNFMFDKSECFDIANGIIDKREPHGRYLDFQKA